MILRMSICYLASFSCLGVDFMDVTDKCCPVFYAGRALLGEGDALQVAWEVVSKRMLYHSLFTLLLS